MATLNSPGVAVTVVDESFYTPSAPGTVPLIVIASAENKQNGAGTGIAPGTLKSNAGNVYLLTSQKDLSDTFGTPIFQTDSSNNPVHAGELNEYGLQAAYSYLGVSNRAFVVRADVDTSQLVASPDAPHGAPVDGTFWVDTADSNYGIFVWNATTQQFVNAVPRVITDYTLLTGVSLSGSGAVLSYTGILSSVGSNGDFAVVAVTTDVTVWNKSAGVWNELGTPAWSGDQNLSFNGYIDNNPRSSALSNVNITGNAGTFTSNASTFTTGQAVTVSGTISATNSAVAIVTATGTSGTFSYTNSAALQTGQAIVVSGTASTATLSNVLVTGLTGTFSCASSTLVVNQPVTLTGSNATTTLSGTITVATGGVFTLGTPSATTLQIGQAVTISGTPSGVTISGYSNPTTYYIIATNGTTTFTLSTIAGGSAITTTAGTLTGATLTAAGASISGYSSPATYYITATNGTTTFTLSSSLGGGALTTTIGAIAATVTVGSGGIVGYSNPTTYYVTATNGTSTFTLSTSLGGSAVTSTLGLFSGLTFTLQAPSIVGYTNPKTYYVIATNGTTTFTLSATSNGTAISTVGGTPTGLTFTAAGVAASGNTLHIVGSVSGGSVAIGETVTWNAGANSATITDGSGSTWTLSSNSLTGTAGVPVAMTITYIDLLLQLSPHTQVPQWKSNALNAPSGSVWVKTTYPNLGANWVVKKYTAATKSWTQVVSNLYGSNHEALYGLDPTGGGIGLSTGTVYVRYYQDPTDDSVNFLVYARQTGTPAGGTAIELNTLPTSGSISFQMAETLPGQSSASASISISKPITGITAVSNPVTTGNAIANAIGQAGFLYITASVNQTTGAVTITHKNGGDISINTMVGISYNSFATTNISHSPLYPADNTRLVGSLWTSTVSGIGLFALSATAPSTTPADGTLWYDSTIDEVDLLVHNGHTWVGLQFQGNGTTTFSSPYRGLTDAQGPIISASQPTARPDGQNAFVTGDLWIDTAGDLDMFPVIKRYNGTSKQWVALDTSDQTTENGVLFHDARWSTNGASSAPGTIAALLASNFLDFDAPDPALYPQGMLLWNLRRSGFNVKKYHVGYVDTTAINHRYNTPAGDNMSTYYANRWVSAAANQENGAGSFGRIAQRKVVLQALKALIEGNQQIRDEESRVFNLIACPGYPETIGDMITLNYDRGISAFVVGDAPARLAPDATTLNNWGMNLAGALDNGDDGLVSFDDYLGVFYPWGYSTDLMGNNIVVPPSHMMLRTIALSDNVSYPWFAPAGVRRGGITNATSVGHVDSITGEFQSVAFNTGQRDTLAGIKVNALTYLRGVGLVNYGQYTRASAASSLDRINVARLVIYLRQQFTQLAKPFVFEPNDKITRDQIKAQAESLLLELVGQRALYDYVVVCDTSNNTPSRIDRNQLYLDIAVEPVKSVEFIYIPIRLENTGAIKALGL
jgi:hypothetical protein